MPTCAPQFEGYIVAFLVFMFMVSIGRNIWYWNGVNDQYAGKVKINSTIDRILDRRPAIKAKRSQPQKSRSQRRQRRPQRAPQNHPQGMPKRDIPSADIW